METTIVNLFGSPGTGKSTSACGLFFLMKTAGYSVELVTEFAKEKVWAEHHKTLAEESALIFSEQNHRLNRLRGKVEYVITDSPLLLSLFYVPPNFPKSFAPFATDMFHSYNNLNFFLKRTKMYNPVGRMQTEEESDKISDKIRLFLDENDIIYTTVNANVEAPQIMFEVLNAVESVTHNKV